MVVVLFGVSVVIFLSIRLVEGDPAEIMGGEYATREDLINIRKQLGLDRPLYIQYVLYLRRLSLGDFGRSYVSRRPVLNELLARYPATLQLAGASMLFAVIFGVFAGVVSATKPYSKFDYSSMAFALGGVSIPVYWLGLMLALLFAVKLRWLPAGGRGTWAHLVLPSITLGAWATGLIARMTRSAMLEVTKSDYIRTARAKGLRDLIVNYRHALKNAMIPVVTIIGLQAGYLLGGAVLTETVFAWPGLGLLIVESIKARDYIMVQGALLFFAASFTLVNLFVDIVYSYLDPRIRRG